MSFTLGAMDLFVRELDKIFEMSRVAFLEQLVGQHLAKRRRNVDRKPRPGTGLVQISKDKN
jgi:hypothetical protein